MSVQDNKARTREFYEKVLNAHDFAALGDYVRDDFVDHNPPPGVGSGVEGVKQTFEMFTAAFPDLRFRIDEMYADGDKVISRLTCTGTHKGEFMGVAPTGKPVEMSGIDIIKVVDGKAVERWGQFDDLGMMQQIGAIPANAAGAGKQ
jgi:predicted ester cyclase